MSAPRHPTTVCTEAARLYMAWVALCEQIDTTDGAALIMPEPSAPAKAARAEYAAHLAACPVCSKCLEVAHE